MGQFTDLKAIISLYHSDFNHREFAIVISILETTAAKGKTYNTRNSRLEAIRERFK